MEVKLSIELSSKQEEILKECESDSYSHIVVSTGRQVGKTLTGTLSGFKWATGKKCSIGFVLPTYKQCKNVFSRYKLMLEGFGDLVTFIAAPDFSITFWNGSTIQFFTAMNDSFRGQTFDYMIIDEACFIKDDIWSVLEACMIVSLSKPKTKRGKLLILSTPKTKNWFYNLTQDEDINVKVFTFTSLEGGLITKDVLDKIQKRIPDYIFRNEYLGEFLDAGSGLFKYIPCLQSNIKSKTVSDGSKNGHIAGLDIASKDDYTVLTIMDKYGNVICVERWRHQDLEQIILAVIKTLEIYGNPLIYVEQNGIGLMPSEFLKKKYKGSTQGWVTTQKSKNDIIQQLILDFNIKNITIPDIDFLKDELDAYTVEWKNGNPVYGGSGGFHDDCIMSLAICNYHRPKISNVKPVIFKQNRPSAI